LVERPEPKPGFGQVFIRIHATSLNYRDLIVVNGQYGHSQRPHLIPVSDGAGEVVEVGSGITRLKVGDRVMGIFLQTWISGEITLEKMKEDLGGRLDGMLTEYVVLSEEGVVLLPEHLSYEEGATLPCAAVTAWHALVAQGVLSAGETVLVLGTGGVSVFAIQFAKLHGARVIAISSHDDKLTRVRALGVDDSINYTTIPEWEKRVWELTAKRGADHVVEVGGAGTLAKSFHAARYGGRVSLIGVLSGFGGEVDPLPVLFKSLRVQGIYVGSRDMFEAMNRAIAQAKLKPVIDRVFQFHEAQKAYHYLRGGVHVGKVVITI
jgi:NADPH:quinone reductase-like Zn-dependent oxidoreductase